MSEITLSRDARLTLRAQAHHLNPVVLLGASGLTEAVMKEIDRELKAHELIKVRVPTDDREEREAIFVKIADELGCARVQMIGKLLVPATRKRRLKRSRADVLVQRRSA